LLIARLRLKRILCEQVLAIGTKSGVIALLDINRLGFDTRNSAYLRQTSLHQVQRQR
jgi:hypothetical protein